MKTIKEIYENNISEDIVYSHDTLISEMSKINKKLDKKAPFFLVVLDGNEKIKGVIDSMQLRKMLDESLRTESLNIKFNSFVKNHISLLDNESFTKALNELKKEANGGFILVRNKQKNYLGKILISTVLGD